MLANLQTLKRTVSPPKHPRCPSGDWAAVEREIGFALPPDYKQFVATYGTGSLQSFMHVWNYLDVPDGTDLKTAIRQVTSEYEHDRRAGYQIAFEPYPRPGCMIPFCSTDDGNYLNWRAVGEPETWCVVAYDCGSGRLIPAEGVNMVQCLAMLARKSNPFGDAFCNVESFEPPVRYGSRE
ncbi:SMI1/KNR4 family protein [Zavarzinella formosa]|uniref:SMI1/KNR4 family protein n=1 Tax=Zavarzinella formosa TaxID=360055 RepID=UPI0021BC2C0C|nr:SMI1/KNR4 family protein [Zavarzinella formosa]